MRLNEIPRHAEIVLTVKDSSTTLDFRTRVRDVIGENGIWVDIIKDGKGRSVSFTGVPVSLSYYSGSGKPVVWSLVTVKLLKVGGELKQAIVTSVEGEEINRRRVYRQKINLPGAVDYGANQEEVMVRDVGSTGFSFVSDGKGTRHGTSIMIVCTYQDGETQITLNGKIVRVQDLDDGKICYGCKFIGRTDLLNKYIRRKKREEKS
ncbi:MAG: PilZ domain-containing protein [Thermoflexaceae bacterium]|nr:PilZ domain-containing protein [Thermoflexaceae bacterium]